MESNIIKFTSITEGESSYSIELSMPFIGISVDEGYKPVSALNYECVVSVMKGTTKLLPSSSATAGTYKLELITSAISGLKNIAVNNTAGKVTFTSDTQNILANGEIQFNVLLEDNANVVMKTIGFTALQGLMGSDGLTYSFDYDNGLVYKFKNGDQYEYTPKTFRIAGYRRQGAEPREKLTNTDVDLSAFVLINNTEVEIPVLWDSTNQVFYISFADNTVLTVNGDTDYITQFNIRRLTINIYDMDDVLLDRIVMDVNYGTSNDAASLVLNPTSIIGAIQNTKISFNTDGVQIYRGGMKIYRGTDNSSEVVFDADENGNLRVRGSIKNGSAMAGWAIREHTMISGGGLVGIGDGNAQSPAGDYAFWAGNEAPEQAPFSVKKTGEMKATLLEIGGTQITPGTIRTGAFAPGAVDNAAIGEDAIDSVNIRQGAIITDHLYANSVTVDKLAADVGQSLDLSSNESINLMAGDLRDAIEYAQENAYGQILQIIFKDGNAFEYGKSNLEIEAHVWKNGEDITDQIPLGAFRWQRVSGDTAADAAWNLQHRGATTINLLRADIGNSCVIRCICDERGVYPVISHTNDGNVYITIPDGGTTDTFSISGYDLYTSGDIYELKDGYLFVDTYTDYLSAESTAFDHSLLQSSHIKIKDDEIEVKSGGEINMLAGSDINIGATADINVAANGNINVENGGHMTVVSGGDITINSGGKLKVAASDIQFTATQTLGEELSDINGDITDLDDRLGEAELKITPSAIVSTVRGDSYYLADLQGATDDANDYTDGKLRDYSTTEGVRSMISQSAESIEASVSETYSTKAEVQNISIGGRNLLVNSKEPCVVNFDPNQLYLIDVKEFSDYGKSVIANDTTSDYTLSFDWGVTVSSNIVFQVYINGIALQDGQFETKGARSGKFVKTFRLTSAQASATEKDVYVNAYTFSVSGILSWSYAKFEKGNKKTDWTAAPEDAENDFDELETRVSEAELKITPSAIVSTVRSDSSYKSDISNATSSANDYTDGKLVSYSTTDEMETYVGQTADSITQSVSRTYSTKTEVQNIAVGGRNILLDSERAKSFSFSASSSSSSEDETIELIEVEIGEDGYELSTKEREMSAYGINLTYNDTTSDYTIAFDWSVNVTANLNFAVYIAGSRINADMGNTNRQRSGRYVQTFKLTSSQASSANRKKVSISVVNPSASGTFTWSYAKLEKGNKVTDWTVAPEETEGDIVELQTWRTSAEIQMSDSHIISTVSEQLLGDYSTTSEMRSYVAQEAGKIELSVVGTNKTNFVPNSKGDSLNGWDIYIPTSRQSVAIVNDATYGNVIRLANIALVSSSSIISIRSPAFELAANEEYTFSMLVYRSEYCTSFNVNIMYLDDILYSYVEEKEYYETPSANQWTKIYFTFTPQTTQEYFVEITHNGSSYLLPDYESDYLYVSQIKVEYGKVATAWVPAAVDAYNMSNEAFDNIGKIESGTTAVGKVSTSTVTIDNSGIAMTTNGLLALVGAKLQIGSYSTVEIKSNGTFSVESGGAVKISADDSVESYISLGEGNFSVTYQGGLVADKAKFNALTVGGYNALTSNDVTRVVVSNTQPAPVGSNILWLKPIDELQRCSLSCYTTENRTWKLSSAISRQSKTLSNFSGSPLSGGTITYKLSVPVYQTYQGDSVTISARISKGGYTINFTPISLTLEPWESETVVFTTSTSTNLCDGGDITVELWGSSGGSKQDTFVQRREYITLDCEGESETIYLSGAKCDVYYL